MKSGGARRLGAVLLAQLFLCGAGAASAQQRDSLTTMSLDSLLSIPVSAAARYAQRVENAPASVTIVTAEQIERFGYRTLSEVLQSVRGFYISNDRNYTYVGVRGFSRPTDYNNRVVLLLNGQILNENYYNSTYVGSEMGIPLDGLERIEIVRGPGSALYGTGAMFSVINLVTLSGEAGQGGQGHIELGSRGQRGASATAGNRAGALDFIVSAGWGESDGADQYYPEFDDPATNNGRVIGLDWERHREAVAVASWGSLRLQTRASSRVKGVPTAAWATEFNDSRTHTRDEFASLLLGYERVVSPVLQVAAKASVNGYHYYGAYPADGYLYEDENHGRWAGVELQVIRDLGPANRLVVGGDFTRNARAEYRAWADPDPPYADDDYPFDTFSAYVQNELQLGGRLSVTGALRFDGHSEAEDVVSPRLGVIYSPRLSSTLKFLYGESFRSPSVYERFFDADEFKPNPELGPERIRAFEVLWHERVAAALFTTVSVYHYRLRDLIDTQVDENDSLNFFTNRDEVRAYGIEAGVNGQLASGVTAYANYALQRAVDAGTDTRLTNSPAHLGRAGVSMRVMPTLGAAAELRYESGRETLYGTRTDPVVVTNLNLTSARLWQGLHASMRVQNAFDRNYATPGGFEHLQPAIRQDGRTITFELGYQF